MNAPAMYKPLIASLCGALLTIGAIAPAHADRDGRGHGRGWDRDDRAYYRYGGPPVVRERVIIREYPRRYYGGSAVYYMPPPPPPFYATVPAYPVVYDRSPSVVIGINVPPLVIPLR